MELLAILAVVVVPAAILYGLTLLGLRLVMSERREVFWREMGVCAGAALCFLPWSLLFLLGALTDVLTASTAESLLETSSSFFGPSSDVLVAIRVLGTAFLLTLLVTAGIRHIVWPWAETVSRPAET